MEYCFWPWENAKKTVQFGRENQLLPITKERKMTKMHRTSTFFFVKDKKSEINEQLAFGLTADYYTSYLDIVLVAQFLKIGNQIVENRKTSSLYQTKIFRALWALNF